MMHRRRFGQAVAAAVATPTLSAFSAPAQSLYNGTLKIVVGFPAGGATDVVARAIVDRLSRLMPQQVLVVENRGGAGGQIAAQLLKAAPADGATVMLSIDHTQVIIPLTIPSAGYNGVTDFTALAGVANYYNVIAVSTATGVTSMEELGRWLKAHPAEANYGVPAAGSVPQLMGQIVGKRFGVPMNSIPYKGGAPMVQDLLAGQVPIGFASMTDLIEHHRAGKLRILASSGQARSRNAPEIPTFKELGFTGLDQNPWIAFFGPRGLPPAYVERFDAAIKAVLAEPELQEKLAKIGNEVLFAPGTEVQKWVVDGTQHWGQVLRDAGFKPQ